MNLPFTIEEAREIIVSLETELGQLKRDFEIVRTASRLFEQASNDWMMRALKAEATVKGMN